jgi:hypothetical protein
MRILSDKTILCQVTWSKNHTENFIRPVASENKTTKIIKPTIITPNILFLFLFASGQRFN